MKFGVCLPNYGEELSVEGLKKIAIEAENLGFTSIWTTDHILMSKNSGTPYENMYESIITLAYVAHFTKYIKLGISSLVMAMRNPIIVAKQLATLDNFSNGRVILATGAGWYQKEFENLGADFENRGKFLNEAIKLIRLLWESEQAINFKGKYFKANIVDGVFSPKPIQKRLPIWIAGNSLSAIKRASKLGDAWHPNILPLDKFKGLIDKYYGLGGHYIAARIAANIKAKNSEYVSPLGERRVILSSNTKENLKVIEALEAMGVQELIVATNFDGKQSVENQLYTLKYILSLIHI